MNPYFSKFSWGLLLVLSISAISFGQPTKKTVLFIGNSYTGSNNLPLLTRNIAFSVGDTLDFISRTPGGAQLNHWANDPTYMYEIKRRSWDHVVIQGQSQEPALSNAYVNQWVYPYAKALCDSARAYDSCNRPIFFRTWGRKNGDATNCQYVPWVCTYLGMDSALAYRYQKMANDNDAYVSPVGEVWKYLRQNHSQINLYTADESHPSLAGSYAGACTFYAVIFRKDPSLITDNAGLSATIAQQIRQAAKTVVYDSLPKWNVGKWDPTADFTMNVNSVKDTCIIQFDASNSTNTHTYYWDFGDGHFDTTTSALNSHAYVTGGPKTIKLIVSNCDGTDSISYTNTLCTIGLNETPLASNLHIYPNPANGIIKVEGADQLGVETIRVYSIHGKVMMYISDYRNEEINVTLLPSGQYILQLETKDQKRFPLYFIKQ